MKKNPFHFTSKNLLQIAMPVGGLGAGNVCLSGYGALRDFSIRHHPDNSAHPGGNARTSDGAFAFLHVKNIKNGTRLVEGPLPPELIYNQGLKSLGGHFSGLPRFASAAFENEFPFGHVTLEDPQIPLRAVITAFNPLIPLDDTNSGLPCAILEYRFENRSRATVDFDFSFNLWHPCPHQKRPGQDPWRNTITDALPGRGVFFGNTEPPESPHFASACLMALQGRVGVKAAWFRGGWFDGISMLWKEIASGAFKPNTGSGQQSVGNRNGGSILFQGSLPPGDSVTFPLVMAWHFPNATLTEPPQPEACCGGGCEPRTAWQPFYAGVWKDARAVAEHVRKNYPSLRERTWDFKTALFASTVPSEVLDAVVSNLAILKSPTILRQKNGNLWAWEGCDTQKGCCHGSCTHVWNYAQSMPHLFPPVERTLREQELLRGMNEEGHIAFRSALPDGPPPHNYHAAADGQLGGILKLHRDWHISGDNDWLRRLYPLARQSLEYCIRTWDPDRTGLLVEPHHNTYDIEFWGSDGMCCSVYIAALCAMAEMADFLGEDGVPYRQLAERGAAGFDAELFNGEYHRQKLDLKKLHDKSFAKQIKDAESEYPPLAKLLKKEGPKYQYHNGCLSDGVIGAWMAALYGIETPMSRNNIRSSLKAIHRHNFKPNLREHANCQRAGFAIGPEAGLLLCTWPQGEKPSLPFVYSDEVWTGIEYQVASHLLMEGLVKEGLDIVRGARSRYDGLARNPLDEYECGSYYARAMASYSLLAAFSGFRYSAVTKTLWFAPQTPQRPFCSFFSTATGFGTLTLDAKTLTIRMVEGSLTVQRLVLATGKKTTVIATDLTATPSAPAVVKSKSR